MATGRMLNKKIGLSKQVNDLTDDTSRLAFTWAIAHLDRDGRIHGEPDVLKALVFPRRQDVTPEQMEQYVREWGEGGLIVWYEADGERWIQYPKFGENQLGLRYDREPASIIPPPQGARILAGSLPEDCRKDAADLAASSAEDSRQTSAALSKVGRLNSMEVNSMERNSMERKRREGEGKIPPFPDPKESDEDKGVKF